MIEAFMQQILNKFAPGTITGVIVEDTTTGTPKVASLASGDANTFGAWAEVDASASANSWICGITWATVNTTATSMIIEIGTGTAGNEATKIRISLTAIYTASATVLVHGVYPIVKLIKVASGIRISARLSANVASLGTKIGVQYYQNLET